MAKHPWSLGSNHQMAKQKWGPETLPENPLSVLCPETPSKCRYIASYGVFFFSMPI